MRKPVKQYVLLGIGKAGWFAEGTYDGHQCRSTSYDASVDPPADLLENCVNGALVYDARGVDLDVYTTFVVCGPMCEPSLPENTVKRLFEGETSYDDGAKLGSLDYISRDVHARRLLALPGIKIGYVRKHKVVWEKVA